MLSSGSGICQICGKYYDRLAAHYIRSHGSRTFVPVGPPTDHAVPPLEEVIIDRDDDDDEGSDSGHHAGEADQSDNAAITIPAYPNPPTRQALTEQESLPTTAAFCRDDIKPFLFSTTVLNRLARGNPRAWKVLGFVPDLDLSSSAYKTRARGSKRKKASE